MRQDHQFQFSTGVLIYPLLFLLAIWMVFWFEGRFGFDFSKYGVYPLTLLGLRGVVLSPFVHGSLIHIYHNTIPLFVLSMALFYFYRPIAWRVIIFGILLSGFLTWCIGRPSYHIGASGLIYVLVSFTFFKGIFSKYYRLVALSLVVVFLYGSMVWYTFPIEEGISWEGHLSGLITGLLFAFLFKTSIAKPKKYVWEQDDYREEDDPFLKHFDQDGNFIEEIPPEIEEHPTIHYSFKETKKNNI